jgi:periplasmic divalent cation tolerance protein
MNRQPETILVLSTAPPGIAEQIAERLVVQRLAACVNITQVRSVYRWQGELCRDREELLICKTLQSRLDAVTEMIRELHSYELPEIIAIPITGGFAGYLSWIEESLK